MSKEGHLYRATRFAFCASTAFLFLLLPALPVAQNPALPVAQNNEAELRQKIKASGGKIYRIRVGTPDKDGWYQAESTHRHFKVRLPAQFNDFVVKDNNGIVVEAATVGTSMPDNSKWLATLVTYTDDSLAKKYFDEYGDKAPKEALKHSLSFQGHPAKEIWINGATRRFAVRNVLVGSEQYALVEYDTTRDLSNDILKFFNSLEFPPTASGGQ
jgi:hypothetical protein